MENEYSPIPVYFVAGANVVLKDGYAFPLIGRPFRYTLPVNGRKPPRTGTTTVQGWRHKRWTFDR